MRNGPVAGSCLEARHAAAAEQQPQQAVRTKKSAPQSSTAPAAGQARDRCRAADREECVLQAAPRTAATRRRAAPRTAPQRFDQLTHGHDLVRSRRRHFTRSAAPARSAARPAPCCRGRDRARDSSRAVRRRPWRAPGRGRPQPLRVVEPVLIGRRQRRGGRGAARRLGCALDLEAPQLAGGRARQRLEPHVVAEHPLVRRQRRRRGLRSRSAAGRRRSTIFRSRISAMFGTTTAWSRSLDRPARPARPITQISCTNGDLR